FAACGITGYVTAEFPYERGGNKMTQFVGRTAASADGLHSYTVFVINDDGVWMLKRPQDFAWVELAELLDAARQNRLVELYKKMRVRIGERRLGVPREVPYTQSFSQWDANVPGTTYFLPVAELTAGYINGLLYTFGEEFAGFPRDDRQFYRPAGIGRF